VDHQAIVSALKARDADAAHLAMLQHLDHIQHELERRSSSSGQPYTKRRQTP
jgi:DNA-binding GntR family transcriptional regulator